MGNRPSDRARALSDRESIQTPSICNRLSEGYQSILHETERMTERPWQQSTASYQALVRSSEEAREKTITRSLQHAWKNSVMKTEDYGFYMDLRKYGSTRHAGFGLGFERCIMYLTGMGNIRDVVPFPRTVNNCEL